MTIKQHGSDPATIHYTVTPSANVLPILPRALFVTSDGNLEITDSNNVTIIYSVKAGLFPFRATKVGANTTANVIAWV